MTELIDIPAQTARFKNFSRKTNTKKKKKFDFALKRIQQKERKLTAPGRRQLYSKEHNNRSESPTVTDIFEGGGWVAWGRPECVKCKKQHKDKSN